MWLSFFQSLNKKQILILFVFLLLLLFVLCSIKTFNNHPVPSSKPLCQINDTYITNIQPYKKGSVQRVVTLNPPLFLGDLQFFNSDQQPVSFKNFRGKTILVNLWASWCRPCLSEIPNLDKLQKDINSDEIDLVTINLDADGPQKALSFFKKNDVKNLNLFYSLDSTIFEFLRKKGVAFGLPVTFIVNSQSYLIEIINGPLPWDSLEARSFLKKIQKLNPNIICKPL